MVSDNVELSEVFLHSLLCSHGRIGGDIVDGTGPSVEHQGQNLRFAMGVGNDIELTSFTILMQVTIVPLGAHSTNCAAAMAQFPPPPAYNNPELPSAVARKALVASISGGTTGSIYDVKGDINKAAAALYRLSEVPNPPLRLVLGKDAVEMARSKVGQFSQEVEEYASWSEGLEKDS